MRIVLVAVGALLVTGCWATHERVDASGSVVGLDAASPRVDAAAPDAARPVDAGLDAVVPADAACIPVDERSTRACVLTPTGAIPAGEPYTLRIARTGCLCNRVCDVRVSGDRLELGVTGCADTVPCAECTTEAECALPPLPEGRRTVLVDGVYAGVVDVAPRAMVREARPACWSIQETPDDSLDCSALAIVDRGMPREICHRDVEDVGAFARFSLTFACTGCFDWSAGCQAQRESSSSIVLRPELEACACPTCGDCAPDVCTERTISCETPPLRDGSYDVFVETTAGTRIRVSRLEVADVPVPGPTRCVSIP